MTQWHCPPRVPSSAAVPFGSAERKEGKLPSSAPREPFQTGLADLTLSSFLIGCNLQWLLFPNYIAFSCGPYCVPPPTLYPCLHFILAPCLHGTHSDFKQSCDFYPPCVRMVLPEDVSFWVIITVFFWSLLSSVSCFLYRPLLSYQRSLLARKSRRPLHGVMRATAMVRCYFFIY